MKYETRDYLVKVGEHEGKRVYLVLHKEDQITALILSQLPAAIVACQALQDDLDKVLADAGVAATAAHNGMN